MEFICDVCDTEFLSARALRGHIAKPPKKCGRVVSLDFTEDDVPRPPHMANDHLFDRYVKEGTKELIDRDPMANIYNFHEDRNLADDQAHSMLVRSRHEISVDSERHVKDMKTVTENVHTYLEKFGNRSEDIAFFNDANECGWKLLEKQREMLMIKLAIVDVHLLKRGPRALVLAELEKFFATDYIKRLQNGLNK